MTISLRSGCLATTGQARANADLVPAAGADLQLVGHQRKTKLPGRSSLTIGPNSGRQFWRWAVSPMDISKAGNAQYGQVIFDVFELGQGVEVDLLDGFHRSGTVSLPGVGQQAFQVHFGALLDGRSHLGRWSWGLPWKGPVRWLPTSIFSHTSRVVSRCSSRKRAVSTDSTRQVELDLPREAIDLIDLTPVDREGDGDIFPAIDPRNRRAMSTEETVMAVTPASRNHSPMAADWVGLEMGGAGGCPLRRLFAPSTGYFLRVWSAFSSRVGFLMASKMFMVGVHLSKWGKEIIRQAQAKLNRKDGLFFA